MVEALALAGRLEGAAEVMDAIVSLGRDLGLYTEEMDPSTQEMRGNFPQALTHLALVTAPALFAEQTPTKLKSREPASEAGDAIARLTELRGTAGRTAAS
jgi:hypothetical protein